MGYRDDGGYEVPQPPANCWGTSTATAKAAAANGPKAAGRAAPGKGDYHEIPPLGIAAVACRLEVGLAKHGPGRAYLRDGVPLSVLMDKALRHTFQALAGESDEDHLAAAAVNLLLVLEVRERIRRGDLPGDLDDIWLG